MVTSIDTDITFEGLSAEMMDICRFDEDQPFTMKWVDEEGKTLVTVLYEKKTHSQRSLSLSSDYELLP